ncbi:hypothetical protein [Planococcus shixiaomingii]|uniref:hypothetical protein n=1 Tax=Planococcus shixiaomingii TaxID=3058393 RepID=UPI00262C74E1|nr:hypothetical protein [Planococcus sp. N022]WKA55599.1 hypothetical protein QWY21_04210 [Planococcus sp. N022]
MKRDASEEYEQTKPGKNDESVADKIVDRAQKFMGVDDDEGNNEAPFQNAPDEDTADVPKKDKIIKDKRTGEETYVENTGDKY